MNGNIEIKGLNVAFFGKDGAVPVVSDINTCFLNGTVTGIIGESGSGKSVLGMSILQLLPETAKVSGSCMYEGQDLYRISEKEMLKIRGKEIAVIPQNPAESLNPILRIGRQLTECVTIHEPSAGVAAKERGKEMLHRFGFEEPEKIASSYSFQLSGGMNQRVISAMGLMNHPKWIIADEPTKGLDAILRRQVYQVLKDIAASEAEGMIVITHDIALAEALCDRLIVIYKGTILEQGSTREILDHPAHPYTRGLIGSLPSRGMHPVPREIPERAGCTSGCRFYPRCAEGRGECAQALPKEAVLGNGRTVRCVFYA